MFQRGLIASVPIAVAGFGVPTDRLFEIRPRKSGMGAVLGPIFYVLSEAVQLYIYAIILSAILSWLIAFDVINTTNRFVYMVVDFLWRITEPALRPIRNFMPNLGGIDISPIILILLLVAARGVLMNFAARAGGL